MLELTEAMPLNFYRYGEAFTGSIKGLRYHMIMQSKEEEDPALAVTIWRGPLSFGKTPRENMTVKFFPFDEEGRDAAINWINEEFGAHPELYGNDASILDL